MSALAPVVSPARRSRARAWVLASRPATLPAAVVPVLVGAAAAYSVAGAFRPLVLAVTLASALLIQIATNLANDYSDFQRGADPAGRLGPLRVVQAGLLSAAEVRRGAAIAFGLAALAGLWLVSIGGWPILAIGSAAIVAGVAYTGGPWPFGYYGLGDLFVFIFFGAIAVTGTAYLQMDAWPPLALVLSVPIGLLVTNILVINNLRDLPTDLAAHKRTLAVRMGERATRAQYACFAALSYAIVIVLGVRGRSWLLLPLISLPLAARLVWRTLGGCTGSALNSVLERSGQLLLAFGGLLALGLLAQRA